MSEPDNKVKSISSLVRLVVILVVFCIVLILLLAYLLHDLRKQTEPPRVFICGNTISNEFTSPGNPQGKALYKANCSSCHFASDKDAMGPGLKGVIYRIPGGNWKYLFVRNSDSLYKAGDAYTLALRQKYKFSCRSFPNLSNEQIDSILCSMPR